MKAICLLSGGLDSQLAIRLILEQGVDIIAVHFRTIFCTCTPKGCGRSIAGKVADELGIPIVEFNNTKDILNIIKNPPHGYGSEMNPCIDCRILMFKKAKEYMEEIGAAFIITGEVLGQRPMSQRKDAMELVERESGLTGLILRPLSALLLPPTIPEEKGWVDRKKLINHCGRSRKVQIKMAERFNMKDYPCASGGCLLTDPGFAKRIEESLEYGEDSINDAQVLKIGRHFRLFNRIKLVVGRNETENKRITNLTEEGDVLIEPVDSPGPTALLRMKEKDIVNVGLNNGNKETLDLALHICARYCDSSGNVVLKWEMKNGSGTARKSGDLSIMPDKEILSNDNCRRI